MRGVTPRRLRLGRWWRTPYTCVGRFGLATGIGGRSNSSNESCDGFNRAVSQRPVRPFARCSAGSIWMRTTQALFPRCLRRRRARRRSGSSEAGSRRCIRTSAVGQRTSFSRIPRSSTWARSPNGFGSDFHAFLRTLDRAKESAATHEGEELAADRSATPRISQSSLRLRCAPRESSSIRLSFSTPTLACGRRAWRKPTWRRRRNGGCSMWR